MIHIKIQADGDEKIYVTLTKTDMISLDITYDELDYSNIETRRVIWTVLDEASRVLGKTLNIDNRLLVQVAPADDGGCLLLFSQLPEQSDKSKKRFVMKKENEPLLYKGFDVNSFMDGICHLNTDNCTPELWDVYKYNNEFYAVIKPKKHESDKLIFTLCEFGEALSPTKKELAAIYEYGEKINLPD